jgi:hypothetical protein
MFTADDDTKRIRRDICSECPSAKEIGSIKYCSECGCIIRWKTSLRKQVCPLKKW